MLTFWIGLIFSPYFSHLFFLLYFLGSTFSSVLQPIYTCMCICVFPLCYHGFNFSKASLFIYLNAPFPLFWPPYFSLVSSCFRCFVFASRLPLNVWTSCLLIFKSEVLKKQVKNSALCIRAKFLNCQVLLYGDLVGMG